MSLNYYNPLMTEAHEAFRLRVRSFAESEIKPVAGELDNTATFSVDITRKMGQIGLLGMTAPAEYGGKNMDTLSYIIAVEELARIDASQAATVAAHNSLGIGPIVKYGTETQKQEFLPRLLSGEGLWAFGLTEPNAGSDANNTETTAVREGDFWVINGNKIFITNSASPLAAGATLQVVTGEKDGRKELTVILVDRNTPGYSCEPITNKMVWRAADTGRLFFNNMRVPVANTLGEVGHGPHIMLETLDSGRLSIAAMGLGLAQGAFEMALDYASKRVQFGKPIMKYQAVSFKLSDMALKIELARNLLYKACWQKDQKLPFGKEAAMAKLYCSEIAKEVADEALQIHGAYGMVRDSPIERFYRDQRILQIGEGTSEILRLVISRHIGIK
ncbi:MAG: acyl-CoA dehydrogenase [Bacteroidetes bacterium GWF2_49_14]|nr:MAG: acyl-CoA dehydrogenase [Bacteroidetes bacterium GWF2_49_14]HBB90705.1 acyl-CoA dehydrogenase [Bacteroidales bacterium]